MALTEVSGGTVNVIASEGLAVNTQTAEVSNIVTGNQIRQLPTLTRNPYDLIGLGGNINNDDPGPAVPGVGLTGRGAGFSINGQRAASTNVLLDGVDNNSVFYGSLAQNVPLEAVAEFRVVTSNFSAEYGRASGGIVNVAVLSGSNDFRPTDSITTLMAYLAACLRETSLVTPSAVQSRRTSCFSSTARNGHACAVPEICSP
jgi:outer membrane receptor protein involved in Fe transport